MRYTKFYWEYDEEIRHPFHWTDLILPVWFVLWPSVAMLLLVYGVTR